MSFVSSPVPTIEHALALRATAPAASPDFEGICDGFRLPDRTAVVARDAALLDGASVADISGSSCTSNIFIGSVSAIDELAAYLLAQAGPGIDHSTFPSSSDVLFVGVFAPVNDRALLLVIGTGDRGWEADFLPELPWFSTAEFAKRDITWLAFGGNDNGVHNLFEDSDLDAMDPAQADAWVQAARAALLTDSVESLGYFLEGLEEAAPESWARYTASVKTKPRR